MDWTSFRLLLLENARVALPPHALAGSTTLSTSSATTDPFTENPGFVTYCGALLNSASTHGRNVYPIFCKQEKTNKFFYGVKKISYEDKYWNLQEHAYYKTGPIVVGTISS